MKSEHKANMQLAESTKAPDIMNERKPLVFESVKQGCKSDSSTWSIL